MSRKAPLIEEVLKYKKEKNLILSMPGNKSGLGFKRDEIGREFLNNMGYLDITEVEPLDNLHGPEGIIKEAQQLLAETYKVKKAFFVVNGSTAGNIAAIYDAFEEGDEVIVERNCHKSIYNALLLRKLKVTFIEAVLHEESGIILPPTEKEIYDAVHKCTHLKGMILTYPNYFGVVYDMEKIIVDLKAKGVIIIIDGAHGAHFGICDKLPKSVVSLADYTVVSAHKTLPVLTQGSYMLVNNDNNIEFYLRAFMTTSPSYLIMSSLDYGRYYLDSYGEDDYNNLVDRANKWADRINKLNTVKVTVIKSNDLPDGYTIDESRYVLMLPKGFSGHKLLNYFRKMKIQCEMSFSQGVVLILSPFNNNEDFAKVFLAIKEIKIEKLKDDDFNISFTSNIPKKELELYEAMTMNSETVSIKESIGKVAKEMIIPYPPGIPLVCPGEIIDEETVRIVEGYLNKNKTILGIDERCVEIIK